MPTALIFDIDGTLVDSVDLHARAWEEAFAHFGYKVSLADARNQIGKGGDQLLPEFLTPEQVSREGKQIEEYRGNLFKTRYFKEVKPFPGVRALFEKAKANGLRLALASSAKADELKRYEQIARIEDLVDVETSSADAEKSKPHPDIFDVAMERLGKGISKDAAIVIGDSPYDAEAAKRAGLRAIGVLCGGFPENSLRQAGCFAIYKDPEDLLRNYDTSPLANS